MEEAKADVLGRARALADRSHQTSLDDLIGIYFRHVMADDVVRLQPSDVLGIVASHRRLADERRPGDLALRVLTPTVEDQGW